MAIDVRWHDHAPSLGLWLAVVGLLLVFRGDPRRHQVWFVLTVVLAWFLLLVEGLTLPVAAVALLWAGLWWRGRSRDRERASQSAWTARPGRV